MNSMNCEDINTIHIGEIDTSFWSQRANATIKFKDGKEIHLHDDLHTFYDIAKKHSDIYIEFHPEIQHADGTYDVKYGYIVGGCSMDMKTMRVDKATLRLLIQQYGQIDNYFTDEKTLRQFMGWDAVDKQGRYVIQYKR